MHNQVIESKANQRAPQTPIEKYRSRGTRGCAAAQLSTHPRDRYIFYNNLLLHEALEPTAIDSEKWWRWLVRLLKSSWSFFIIFYDATKQTRVWIRDPKRVFSPFPTLLYVYANQWLWLYILWEIAASSTSQSSGWRGGQTESSNATAQLTRNLYKQNIANNENWLAFPLRRESHLYTRLFRSFSHWRSLLY